MAQDAPEFRRQLVKPQPALVQLNSRFARNIPVLINPLLSLPKRTGLVGPKYLE
jgi:hypothetical protein